MPAACGAETWVLARYARLCGSSGTLWFVHTVVAEFVLRAGRFCLLITCI